MSAEELGIALRRRFPQAPESLEKDLADCEQAIGERYSAAEKSAGCWCRLSAATAKHWIEPQERETYD